MHVQRYSLAALLVASSSINAEPVFEQYAHLQPLHYVLNHARAEFAPFLDVILRQMASEKFFAIVDDIEHEFHPKTDQAWYRAIMQYASKRQTIIGKYTPLYRLQALRYQRSILAEQLKQLIADKKDEIITCLEIGKPATYSASLRDYLPNLQTIFVVHDKQSITDRFESFTIKHPLSSYNHYIPLNNYEPIRDIEPGSVDLIICTIGLHHVPQEKLDAFVASIKMILRPGGIFILRDHDACDAHVHAIVSAAHTIFNALLAQEPLEQEVAEYRNFRPLNYWIELLEQHGFEVGTERLVQSGDPTHNTMIQATRIATNIDEQEVLLSKKLATDKNYTRDLMQTYLTTPEWINVDVAQEYGNFINHTPFYEFPWMQSATSYWKAFAGAYKSAISKRGFIPVIVSPYTAMNIFIGITMSIEHAAKACISAPMRWIYSGAETETLHALVYDPQRELTAIDSKIIVIQEYAHHVMHVTLPRYKLFLEIIKKLPITSIDFKEIAGQKEIVCKVKFPKASQQELAQTIDGFKINYTWTLPTQPNHIYAAITVPVNKLRTFIDQLQQKAVELLYVHDF